MTSTTKTLALVLTLGAASMSCKPAKEPQPIAKNNAESTPGSAIQETEPLEFRIDGMRRVNGAL